MVHLRPSLYSSECMSMEGMGLKEINKINIMIIIVHGP